MSIKLDQLSAQLKLALSGQITHLKIALDEISIECKVENYLTICTKLRDHAELKFEQLIDLCGVDYSDYGGEEGDGLWQGSRYAVVLHLLSVSLN